MKRFVILCAVTLMSCSSTRSSDLQSKLESIDTTLRERYGITDAQTEVGVMDLKRGDVAMIYPDRIEYAASVAKVGILYAYFKLHPDGVVDAQTKHELGLMIKISSNEMAAKYSQLIGLHQIQDILNADGFYDPAHGGGIWVGKHYGVSTERYGDPIANHSHAVTVRQLIRFYRMLEEGTLVSPAASKTMREIFESPDIPHDDHRFVKALDGRNLQIIRKWGDWETWFHDTAVVTGPNRHYIVIALTNHPKGDDYLADFARAVDDLMYTR